MIYLCSDVSLVLWFCFWWEQASVQPLHPTEHTSEEYERLLSHVESNKLSDVPVAPLVLPLVSLQPPWELCSCLFVHFRKHPVPGHFTGAPFFFSTCWSQPLCCSTAHLMLKNSFIALYWSGSFERTGFLKHFESRGFSRQTKPRRREETLTETALCLFGVNENNVRWQLEGNHFWIWYRKCFYSKHRHITNYKRASSLCNQVISTIFYFPVFFFICCNFALKVEKVQTWLIFVSLLVSLSWQ